MSTRGGSSAKSRLSIVQCTIDKERSELQKLSTVDCIHVVPKIYLNGEVNINMSSYYC